MNESITPITVVVLDDKWTNRISRMTKAMLLFVPIVITYEIVKSIVDTNREIKNIKQKVDELINDKEDLESKGE